MLQPNLWAKSAMVEMDFLHNGFDIVERKSTTLSSKEVHSLVHPAEV